MNLTENLSDLVDKFQRDNSIVDEGLLTPAAVLAMALVDKNGVVVLNPNDKPGMIAALLAGGGAAALVSGFPGGVSDGLGAKRIARATFDPSGNAAHQAIGAHGLGVTLPINAIVTRFWYDVITTFTSATDAATVALHAESANGLLAAIAISDASNVLDAGIHAGKPGYPNFGADAAHDTQVEVAALFAATMIKTTAARELTATVAVEAVTAGKMVLFAEYVISN